MHVVLVNFSMQMGGAERVLSLMANHWVEKQWQVTIITFDSAESFYFLDARVRHLPLAVYDPLSAKLLRLKRLGVRLQKLRQAFVRLRPDVIVSFQTNTNIEVLIASIGLAVPVIVSERVDPSAWPARGRLPFRSEYQIYRRAAAVVTQTQRVANLLPKYLRKGIAVIGNPVQPPSCETTNEASELLKVSPESTSPPTIISIGRLVHQKGYDILLHAFAALPERHSHWQVVLVGDGPARSELECLCNELQIKDRVSFLGAQKSIRSLLSQSQVFVLSSRFEGFPNSLCEAMASGIAVIATDCPSGPREIIRHGFNGYLIPSEDQSALTAALDQLLTDGDLRARLSQNAPAIMNSFGVSHVMDQWETLIAKVFCVCKGQLPHSGNSSAIENDYCTCEGLKNVAA
jgi:GalNAc-alpha-(1->4)-GalNAc-alpha-(1->3)-diNAcBac-PP-undecaprenol alpha-1,4-N-acetyl-D-galactosaminyltransferase